MRQLFLCRSLAAGKIDQPTVDQMRRWPHSGFSVDNSVYLSARDTAGLERLAQYILRCPFSLARVVRLIDDGSVLYRAERDHCRRFPRRDKGEHLVRYYGWYSHRQRGLRAKSDLGAVSDSDSTADEITTDRSAVGAQKSPADGPRPGSLSMWAMLIKRAP